MENLIDQQNLIVDKKWIECAQNHIEHSKNEAHK